MHKIALFLHLLGACVWVGGHLYLLIRLMPKFVKTGDVKGFIAFEKSYEPLGMTALVVQVLTGFYMLNNIVPISLWGQPMGYVSWLIYGKLGWLFLTIVTAMHVRFFVVAKLINGTHTPNTLKIMMFHVKLICLWSLMFVVTGLGFHYPLNT